VEAPTVDLNGGLAGVQAVVELSLNGQNFTQDGAKFTYHGAFEPCKISVIAPPEGVVVEAAPAAKGKKGEDAADASLVLPGSKLACEVLNLVPTKFAAIRAELKTKVGDEEPQAFRTVDFEAKIELVTPSSSAPAEDAGAKGKKGEAAPTEEEAPEPVEMLVSFAPPIRTEDLPDPSAILTMTNMAASLNGQSFVPIAEAVTWRLQPLAPEPVAGEEPG